MLYGPEVAVPPAPIYTTIRRCGICGGTAMLADDIPCPACPEETP